jgi:lysine 2,3-aminomutase
MRIQHYPGKEAISAKSAKLLRQLFSENPRLEKIYEKSESVDGVRDLLRIWAEEVISDNSDAVNYYEYKKSGQDAYRKLRWKDLAAIRILDYLDNTGREIVNPHVGGEKIIIDPFNCLWLAARQGTGGARPFFFEDMIQLFRQFTGRLPQYKPERKTVEDWMHRWRHGLEPDTIREREQNKERIIRILVDRIESCDPEESRYAFDDEITYEQKINKVREWWDDHMFHLRFAVRNPQTLNQFLDQTLDIETRKLLLKAEKKGIPFFVNPYYLSLLTTKTSGFSIGSDLAIRDYIIYSEPLIDQFGDIEAWEKEDEVEPGKPNAAGWLLPSHHNVHRRYPEVAIMIPDTMGRACGGLCVSCQRMYDFQRGNLNFNLDKLRPDESWDDKLKRLLDYYENDSQLRDILITGGDALMSRDKPLERILNEVYLMAVRKREANKNRPENKKYAEMLRIRLGTRLLAYLPQRVTPALQRILSEFKEKASAAGMKQFVIQTHFESPMEVTPETKLAVQRLIAAGWTVTNQLVFTAAASRRGHTALLRKVLNDIGVITYYTFSVKGFWENTFNFATNARAVQEQIEEKCIGKVPAENEEEIRKFTLEAEKMVENLENLRKRAGIPFLATDRNVLNLPAVGKSMTFRTIGITRKGERILEFDHDSTRWHSPIIDKLGKMIIVESKPVGEYLKQIDDMGEDVDDYQSIWGYSIAETEPRMPIYEYPDYPYNVTGEITNLQV